MMKYIRRWDVETMDQRTQADGMWVLFSDHEHAVLQLEYDSDALMNLTRKFGSTMTNSEIKAYFISMGEQK
jgi:hypothetical protein